MVNRCGWANPKNPLYIRYHDEEWGVPVHDDYKLFEALVLDGVQAGLSWETILNKRENYRKAFDEFDYEKVARYSEEDAERLMTDAGIVRNRLKINSAITNAQQFIKVRKEYGSFDAYLWGFTGNKTIVNHPQGLTDIPASTELSDRISKDLKKRGFKFVGTTIIYAMLQAIGIIDDHLISCDFKRNN